MKMPESAEYVVNHENYFLHDTAHSHTSVRVFGIPSFNESPLSCHARLPTKFDFSWHERYPFQTLMLYVHVCSSEGVSVWVCVCECVWSLEIDLLPQETANGTLGLKYGENSPNFKHVCMRKFYTSLSLIFLPSPLQVQEGVLHIFPIYAASHSWPTTHTETV